MTQPLTHSNPFTVRYEYFGLCTSANVCRVGPPGAFVFQCRVPASDEIVEITCRTERNMHLWVELNKEQPTALAQQLGQAIEDIIGPVCD